MLDIHNLVYTNKNAFLTEHYW